MTANDSVIALDYTPTLVELAGFISHLPGFAYLDSGEREGSAELEIVTALPTRHTNSLIIRITLLSG